MGIEKEVIKFDMNRETPKKPNQRKKTPFATNIDNSCIDCAERKRLGNPVKYLECVGCPEWEEEKK